MLVTASNVEVLFIVGESNCDCGGRRSHAVDSRICSQGFDRRPQGGMEEAGFSKRDQIGICRQANCTFTISQIGTVHTRRQYRCDAKKVAKDGGAKVSQMAVVSRVVHSLLVIEHSLKVRQTILRVPLAKPLPAFHRISIAMIFPKMSCSGNIDALKGRITT